MVSGPGRGGWGGRSIGKAWRSHHRARQADGSEVLDQFCGVPAVYHPSFCHEQDAVEAIEHTERRLVDLRRTRDSLEIKAYFIHSYIYAFWCVFFTFHFEGTTVRVKRLALGPKLIHIPVEF